MIKVPSPDEISSGDASPIPDSSHEKGFDYRELINEMSISEEFKEMLLGDSSDRKRLLDEISKHVDHVKKNSENVWGADSELKIKKGSQAFINSNFDSLDNFVDIYGKLIKEFGPDSEGDFDIEDITNSIQPE